MAPALLGFRESRGKQPTFLEGKAGAFTLHFSAHTEKIKQDEPKRHTPTILHQV